MQSYPFDKEATLQTDIHQQHIHMQYILLLSFPLRFVEIDKYDRANVEKGRELEVTKCSCQKILQIK